MHSEYIPISLWICSTYLYTQNEVCQQGKNGINSVVINAEYNQKLVRILITSTQLIIDWYTQITQSGQSTILIISI